MSRQVKFGAFDDTYDIATINGADVLIPKMLKNRYAIRVFNDGTPEQFVAILQKTRYDLKKPAVSLQKSIFNIVEAHSWDDESPIIIINNRSGFQATGWRVSDFDPERKGQGTAFVTEAKPRANLPDEQYTRYWDDYDIMWDSIDELPCADSIQAWLRNADENADFDVRVSYEN